MTEKTPIRMLHDRVLVSVDKEGERRSPASLSSCTSTRSCSIRMGVLSLTADLSG